MPLDVSLLLHSRKYSQLETYKRSAPLIFQIRLSILQNSIKQKGENYNYSIHLLIYKNFFHYNIHIYTYPKFQFKTFNRPINTNQFHNHSQSESWICFPSKKDQSRSLIHSSIFYSVNDQPARFAPASTLHSLIKATFTRSCRAFADHVLEYIIRLLRTYNAATPCYVPDMHTTLMLVRSLDDNWDGRITRVHYATGQLVTNQRSIFLLLFVLLYFTRSDGKRIFKKHVIFFFSFFFSTLSGWKNLSMMKKFYVFIRSKEEDCSFSRSEIKNFLEF